MPNRWNPLGDYKCLSIAVFNPDKYLSRLPITGRLIAKASRAFGGDEITIYFFGLTHSGREAWNFLNEHYFPAYYFYHRNMRLYPPSK